MNKINYNQLIIDRMNDIGSNPSKLSRKFGVYPSTITGRLNSEKVGQTIELITELGLKIVDENGVDIITGESIVEEMIKEIEAENEGVRIGNLFLNKKDIIKFKEVLKE